MDHGTKVKVPAAVFAARHFRFVELEYIQYCNFCYSVQAQFVLIAASAGFYHLSQRSCQRDTPGCRRPRLGGPIARGCQLRERVLHPSREGDAA
jgi:hypothetical protein